MVLDRLKTHFRKLGKAPPAGGTDDSLSAASGRYWGDVAAGGGEDVEHWRTAPGVCEWVNRRLTGDPAKEYIIHFAESLRDRWPLADGLSIGCGTGNIERGGVGFVGAFAHMDGVDVSEEAIRVAREEARREGLADRLDYHHVDALTYLGDAVGGGKRYDVVIFNFILHHLAELEEILDLAARALREDPAGLIYIDEYIGPSRDQWTDQIVGFAAGLFELIPEECRRTGRVWPPVVMDDPTEMIRSDEIESIVRKRLEVKEWVPYYGNILHPLVCAIKGSSLDDPRVQRILEEAFVLEDYLAERSLIDSHFAVAVCGARNR